MSFTISVQMSFSLLAHLYPRIKGSQEDVATYSLAYILEQSGILNVSFTKLIFTKLHLEVDDILSYHCQDADPKYGRPDIAGYIGGRLKFFAKQNFMRDSLPISRQDIFCAFKTTVIRALFLSARKTVLFPCGENCLKEPRKKD